MTAFFDCWARKEAFIKARGDGLSIPLDTFRVSLNPELRATTVEIRDEPDESCAWTIHPFSPASGFSGAIAIRERRADVYIRRATARDILGDTASR
jgi:4'-phosphopantetheinyl transferase